jgi:hypothetical protein
MADEKTGTIGLHSSTYIYDAFVGAFTLVLILALVLVRVMKPYIALLKFEVGSSALLWVFWLGESAASGRLNSGQTTEMNSCWYSHHPIHRR